MVDDFPECFDRWEEDYLPEPAVNYQYNELKKAFENWQKRPMTAKQLLAFNEQCEEKGIRGTEDAPKIGIVTRRGRKYIVRFTANHKFEKWLGPL